MSLLLDKVRKRNRRKIRIRKKIKGNGLRPRLSVFKSNLYLYVQAIDDEQGRTLASAPFQKGKISANTLGGKRIGELMAEELKKQSIIKVVFDRNGYKYHGVIKAIADSLRENGIEV